MSKAVICLVTTQLQAEAIITRLRAAELQIADISLLLVERTGMLGLARDRDSALNGGKQQAAAASDPVGGVLGMLSGIGIVSIPGAGAHICAGPLMAALGAENTVGTPNSPAEALVRMACPPTHARRYEQMVRQGSILLAVQTLHPQEIQRATAIMLEAHADDICVSEEGTRCDSLN